MRRPTHVLPLRHRFKDGSVGRRAFTIAEVMVAAAVMAFAISTSVTTMQRGFITLDSARAISLAGQIMQCEIEKMRMTDWTTVNAYPTDSTALTIDTVFTSNSTVNTMITSRSMTLTRTVSDPMTDIRAVTFTVTWTTIEGRSISRSYTTYYGRYGLYDYYANTST